MGGTLLVVRTDGELQSFPENYFKSDLCEGRCFSLYGRLSMRRKGSVASK